MKYNWLYEHNINAMKQEEILKFVIKFKGNKEKILYKKLIDDCMYLPLEMIKFLIKFQKNQEKILYKKYIDNCIYLTI